MKKLLEFLVTSIVKYPDQVVITESQEGEMFHLRLDVHKEDIRLVIGRNGKTIRAIRNLLRLKAIKEGTRINLTLVTPEDKTAPSTS